jgi:hypothetical protein
MIEAIGDHFRDANSSSDRFWRDSVNAIRRFHLDCELEFTEGFSVSILLPFARGDSFHYHHNIFLCKSTQFSIVLCESGLIRVSTHGKPRLDDQPIVVSLSEDRRVPLDPVSTAKFGKRPADQHHAHGQFLCGRCLFTPIGVPIDLVSAAKYCKVAADQNHPDGQFYYGCCPSRGRGVPIDLVSAAKYFKLAADQNHADGQFNYGVCLSEGRGVPIDLV